MPSMDNIWIEKDGRLVCSGGAGGDGVSSHSSSSSRMFLLQRAARQLYTCRYLAWVLLLLLLLLLLLGETISFSIACLYGLGVLELVTAFGLC